MLNLFLVIVAVLADQDYLSSKFVTDYVDITTDTSDIHFYFTLRICIAGGKVMTVPFNSTHYEYKYYEDEECKQYIKSEYYRGTYFDDISPYLENCYAYTEQGDKELKHTGAYVTFNHRYCNRYNKETLLYVDYADGFFYLNEKPINASEVVYPTCLMKDESLSEQYIRFYRNTWRTPSYQRTNLGGKGMKQQVECDSVIMSTIGTAILILMFIF